MSERQMHLEAALTLSDVDHLFEDVDDEKLSWSDLLVMSCVSFGIAGLCGILHALLT